MSGVSYALADFNTGGPILDLSVMAGARWNTALNMPDALSCSIDLNDADMRALDLRSSAEPMKTVLFARNDDDVILAWGLIPDGGRTWNEDTKTLDLVGVGVESSYFGKTVIAPTSALTASLTVVDAEGYTIINPALDTTVSGVSHGTIGKRLVEQRLAFPGAPTAFILPADEPGFRTQTYQFGNLKKIGAALSDLTEQERGPDFAFVASRAPDGLGIRYRLLHGSEAEPRIGVDAGVWTLGGTQSPISKLKITDAVAAGGSLGLMTAGKTSGKALVSRRRNTSLLTSGYPPFDVIDTSHSDVSIQETLDSYNADNMADASKTIQDLTFSVRGDASPGLGQFRPGDRITIDPPSNHPWHTDSIQIRVTSIAGDETGLDLKIGCVILNGS